jgi:hypothetical protein
MRKGIIFSGLLLLPAALAASDRRKTQLTPPDGAPIADARGSVELESHELSIRIQNVEPSTAYGVWLADAAGTLTEVGTITSNAEGKGSIEFERERSRRDGDDDDDSDDGDDDDDGNDDDDDDDSDDEKGSLPFDVVSADQLAGRSIEIRTTEGVVILSGTTPDLRFRGEDREGSSQLLPPDPASGSAANGTIELRQRDGRQRILVEIEDLPSGVVYEVVLTNPATQTSETIGSITTRENGKGRLRLDSKDGDAMPFGVGSLAELTGFEVAVRDPDGVVVLAGVVATPRVDGPRDGEAKGKSCLTNADPASPIRGKIEVKLEEDGGEEIEVEVRGLTPGEVYSVVLTKADATTETIGEIAANPRGRGELEIETDDGGTLPLGATSLADLVGVKLTIVDAAGSVLLEGTIPAIGDLASCDGPDDDDENDDSDDDDDDNDDLPKIEAKIESEDGGPELEVEVEHLAVGLEVSIVIVSAAGEASEIAALTTDDDGKAKVRFGSRTALPLPLGAITIDEILGLEVRAVNASGETLATTTIRRSLDGDDDDEDDDRGHGFALVVLDEFAIVGSFDAPFLRGDANGDRGVDISDPIRTFDFLFRGGATPKCLDAADANDDGAVDISDSIWTLLSIFRGGSEPPAPGTFIDGFDPTPDDLFCEEIPAL